MTLISALTQVSTSTLSGIEEFVVNVGGVDRKVTATQIVQGVVDDLNTEITATNGDITLLDSCKMEKGGDTMTGLLVLSGDPTAALGAATKQYVDAADALKADLASPTLTGTPAAPTAADGTSTTQIATTAFVLNQLDEYMFERTAVTSSPKTLTEDEAGIVGVNVAGNVTINLPQISGLSSAGRVFYLIKDEGYQASASQTITISRGGSDTIDNSLTSITITDAGEGVYLYNDGGTAWYTADPKTAATTTLVGEVELATDAETLTRTDTARAVTPSNLDHLLKNTLYKTTVLGAASKTFTEAEQGLWYVTYTNTGTVALTLPSPAALSDATNTQYHIVDAGDATTNNITITSAAGNINGASSFTISTTQTGARFFNDGTDWYTASDTASLASTVDSLSDEVNTITASVETVKTVATQTYVVQESDGGKTILLTYNSGNRTITLPAISTLTSATTFRVTIKNAAADNSYGTTINRSSTDTIDPSALTATYLPFPGDHITLVTDGTNWYVESNHTIFDCVYDLSGNQSLSNAAWEDIQWDQIKGASAKDPFTWMDLTTNYEFISPALANYVVTATLEFAANATGQRGVRIYRNTETVSKAETYVDATAAGTTVLSVSATCGASVAKGIRVQGYQSSTGALNVTAGDQCRLSITAITLL